MCSIGNPFFLAHGYAVYEVTMKSFMQSGEWCNVSEMWKIQYLWILPALQPVKSYTMYKCRSLQGYEVAYKFSFNEHSKTGWAGGGGGGGLRSH